MAARETFLIEYTMGENQENIIINTDPRTNKSKEEIINQAFQFHSQGKLSKAREHYQYLIKQGCKNHKVYSNYGAILQDHGKLKEAELSTRKAVKLKPDYAIAHYNLGTILKDLGKSQEALQSYIKAIEIDPLDNNTYISITSLIRDSDQSQFNQTQLKEILNLLLEKNVVPHHELFKTFIFLYNNEIINNLNESESDLLKESSFTSVMNDEVIIKALKKIIFRDIRFEKILTKLRKYICTRIAKAPEDINESHIEFIIALGEQCFLNEYIYLFTQEEDLLVNRIIDRCKNGKLNEINISILSCYFPLYKLLKNIPSLKTFKSSNNSFQKLIKFQIFEPLKEIELSKNIKKLGKINDNISQQVKSQYEENPYPRWRYESDLAIKKISISTAINNEITPNFINRNQDGKDLKVLIAGCGTGNQILQSQRYKNANITAIDLSLSSLSYAQRKINELGIENTELIEMDILEVGLLKTKFHIIECGGVLHHMNDPCKGLKVLLDILELDGCLKLGLYSDLARNDIVKARNYIAEKNLKPTITDIRLFRQDIIDGTDPEIENLQNISGFYSTSEFRDLCFHVQEHRFTIDQLQEILKSNGLEFLGFITNKQIKSLYKQYFPEDKAQINLQNWAKLERSHPNTFIRMYQFWVRKTKA